MVKERAALYSAAQPVQKYKEEVYTAIKTQDLIVFGIYSVTKNGETCTFERLVAECFFNFPKVFGFARYPNWPDSLKFDRSLRTLRERGLIVGGAGGKYSPGEFSLTPFGENVARQVEKILNKGSTLSQGKKKAFPQRSVDEKIIAFLKKSVYFRKFRENPYDLSISEPEFRNLLRCTLETPERVLKQNLEYCINLANSYEEKQLSEFLLHCGRKFIKRGSKNG